ncbi:DUF4838 domain-containing protein [bacterium]|nr:DUF4838 domain-containing protein [bacterium]
MSPAIRQCVAALFFIVLAGLALSAASVGAGVTIMVDPGSFPGIEQAATGEETIDWWDDNLFDDRACTECFAAMELLRFLPACTVIPESAVQVQPSVKLPQTGDVILVGNRKSNKLVASFPLPDSIGLATDESFCIRAFSDNGRTVTVIEGRDRIGTLYGVYGYLELLGMRFYGLGETGTVYPVKKGELPANLTTVGNPSFLTRGYHAWEDRGSDDFFLWMARNRMNFWTAAEKEIHLMKKLGMKCADGGHTIQMICLNPQAEYPYNHPKFKGDENKPKDPYAPGKEYTADTNGDGKLSYFEAHPEWYGLRKGKRSDNIKDEFGDNYCTSNADATKELAKNVVQELIDGRWRYVDILNFWMMDNRDRWCECDVCAQQGSYTDRLFLVVHAVLEEIRKARGDGRLKRDVELSSLAYLDTITPPTRPLPRGFDYAHFSITFFPIERCYNHTLADPSCTEYNDRLCRSYQAWVTGQYYRGTMFIGEYYNISYLKSLPMLYTRIMAADIPWYYRTGTRHLHYMHTPTALWGTWTLNQYLLARLLWNAGTDADALLDEYFSRYYPTTSGETRCFYRDLETAMESFKAIRYWGWKTSLKSDKAPLFPKKHFQYEPCHPLTDDGVDLLEMKDYMERARTHFDAALLMCTDETERLRLLEDGKRFAYGEAMFYFHYHLFRTALFNQRKDEPAARRECAELMRYAEQLRGMTDLVQVSSSHANAKDGLDATQAADVYEFFVEKYGK